MTVVIACRGISEQLKDNMLSRLVAGLPADWTRIELPWAASYGPANPTHNPMGVSFDRALADGYVMLQKAIEAHPLDDVVLVGYSGGAALIGNLLAKWTFPNVKAVVLVADPFAPGGRIHGIAGNRVIPGYNVLWVSNPEDVICSCPEGSPLRAIADLSAAFALGDPAAWTVDIIDRLRTDRWQEATRQWWNPFGILGRYVEAINDAAGYLGYGRINEHLIYSWALDHSRRAGAPTWLDAAAGWVRGQLI
jgi:pimeloyl-ACP methyl ester carboxylesterase